MVDMVTQEVNFDRDIHLLALVQCRLPIKWKDLIHVHVRELKLEKSILQRALDCLAICLSANEADRVSVSLEDQAQAEGPTSILIARDRRTGDQDEAAAEAVFNILRKAGCAAEPAEAWDILIAHFPSLVRNKVKKLHQLISQLRRQNQEVAETSSDSESEIRRPQSVDTDLVEIGSWASEIIEAEKINYAIWGRFVKAIKDKLKTAMLLSSLRRDLDSIMKSAESIWIFLAFLHERRALQYHFVDFNTTPSPKQRVEGKYKPIDVLKDMVSPNGFEGRYPKAWDILKKTISFPMDGQTEPSPANEQTFSLSQTMHAEVQIILDTVSRGALGGDPKTKPSCIIGSSAATCVCCALWIRFYNEQCGKAWVHKRCDEKVSTDWVAPLGDEYAISRKNLENIKHSVSNEIQRAMRTCLQKELNNLVSYGDAAMRQIEIALDKPDEADESDVADKWVDG